MVGLESAENMWLVPISEIRNKTMSQQLGYGNLG